MRILNVETAFGRGLKTRLSDLSACSTAGRFVGNRATAIAAG